MPFRVPIRVFLLPIVFISLLHAAFCQSNATEVTTLDGCLAKSPGVFMLNDGFGNERTLLAGNTIGLDSHIGDELSVTGVLHAAPKDKGAPKTLVVSSYRTILKKQPGGVQAQTGDPKSWSSFRNAKYGVGMRYPSKWATPTRDRIEIGSNVVNDDGIEFLHAGDVPDDAYPGSNFVGGQFALVVDTGIEDAGSCRQFGLVEDPVTAVRTAKGIFYTETDISNVGMGTVDITYSAHTFQNGYCYEFDLQFGEKDGTGMDLACATQWVTTDNEQDLLKSLVSQVTFTKPEVKHVFRRKTGLSPIVTSLEITHLNNRIGTLVDVSWSAEGTDYVQLLYPCTKGLYLNGMGGELNGEIKCGLTTNANYPRNGSGKILLLNYNADTASFVLTVKPFRDGLAYDKGAKTVTVDVSPTPHVDIPPTPPSAAKPIPPPR